MNEDLTGVVFRRMSAGDRQDAFALLKPPPGLQNGSRERGESALARALSLFEDRPDYGFVWLAYEDERPLACCTVAFAISSASGGLVARIDDFAVAPDAYPDIVERTIAALGEALKAEEVVRLEATLDVNAAAYALALEGMGFRNLPRLTWTIPFAQLPA